MNDNILQQLIENFNNINDIREGDVITEAKQEKYEALNFEDDQERFAAARKALREKKQKEAFEKLSCFLDDVLLTLEYQSVSENKTQVVISYPLTNPAEDDTDDSLIHIKRHQIIDDKLSRLGAILSNNQKNMNQTVAQTFNQVFKAYAEKNHLVEKETVLTLSFEKFKAQLLNTFMFNVSLNIIGDYFEFLESNPKFSTRKMHFNAPPPQRFSSTIVGTEEEKIENVSGKPMSVVKENTDNAQQKTTQTIHHSQWNIEQMGMLLQFSQSASTLLVLLKAIRNMEEIQISLLENEIGQEEYMEMCKVGKQLENDIQKSHQSEQLATQSEKPIEKQKKYVLTIPDIRNIAKNPIYIAAESKYHNKKLEKEKAENKSKELMDQHKNLINTTGKLLTEKNKSKALLQNSQPSSLSHSGTISKDSNSSNTTITTLTSPSPSSSHNTDLDPQNKKTDIHSPQKLPSNSAVENSKKILISKLNALNEKHKTNGKQFITDEIEATDEYLSTLFMACKNELRSKAQNANKKSANEIIFELTNYCLHSGVYTEEHTLYKEALNLINEEKRAIFTSKLHGYIENYTDGKFIPGPTILSLTDSAALDLLKQCREELDIHNHNAVRYKPAAVLIRDEIINYYLYSGVYSETHEMYQKVLQFTKDEIQIQANKVFFNNLIVDIINNDSIDITKALKDTFDNKKVTPQLIKTYIDHITDTPYSKTKYAYLQQVIECIDLRKLLKECENIRLDRNKSADDKKHARYVRNSIIKYYSREKSTDGQIVNPETYLGENGYNKVNKQITREFASDRLSLSFAFSEKYFHRELENYRAKIKTKKTKHKFTIDRDSDANTHRTHSISALRNKSVFVPNLTFSFAANQNINNNVIDTIKCEVLKDKRVQQTYYLTMDDLGQALFDNLKAGKNENQLPYSERIKLYNALKQKGSNLEYFNCDIKHIINFYAQCNELIADKDRKFNEQSKLKKIIGQRILKFNAILSYHAVEIDNIATVEQKHELYYQQQYSQNLNISNFMQTEHNDTINWFVYSLYYKILGENVRQDRIAKINSLTTELMQCKTKDDYLKLLQHAYDLLKKEKEKGYYFDNFFGDTIFEMCLKVVNLHMLDISDFNLNFSPEQLEKVKTLLQETKSLTITKQELYLPTQNKLDEVIKVKKQYELEALLNHLDEQNNLLNNVTRSNHAEIARLNRESQLNHQKRNKYEIGLVNRVVNRLFADKVISTDMLVQETGKISTAGSAIAAIAHKAAIPGADFIKDGAEAIEHHQQLHESTERDLSLTQILNQLYENDEFKDFRDEHRLKESNPATITRLEEIMKVVAKISYEIFVAQINEMKIQTVEEFQELNAKKVLAATSPDKLNQWFADYCKDKNNSLDFIQYLVLSAWKIVDLKNTVIPGKRDSYKTENNEKKHMSLQGITENIGILRQKNNQLQIYATEPSIGEYDERKGDQQITPDKRNQAKILKYGFTSHTFFDDKKVRKAIYRKRFYIGDAKDNASGFKKDGAKDKSVNYQEHVTFSLKQKFPAGAAQTQGTQINQEAQAAANKRFGKAG